MASIEQWNRQCLPEWFFRRSRCPEQLLTFHFVTSRTQRSLKVILKPRLPILCSGFAQSSPDPPLLGSHFGFPGSSLLLDARISSFLCGHPSWSAAPCVHSDMEPRPVPLSLSSLAHWLWLTAAGASGALLLSQPMKRESHGQRSSAVTLLDRDGLR